ncbi:Altered inheritance of mitochondria protein 18 mitochondrial [Didymella glomerata]|uniref:Altered inheritance of mitochondria protein 18 mitochondrial n=1 Tax=Didymella glomerata TaxID=749621 RepID=A0A9W8WT68_9PLEO|nr:Altered inheritance of mitochondria protein 18 mitochondrial [Didymella glomerata]
MMSARLAARRPVFQCLNAPTRSRTASHQARSDVDAILRQAQGRPLPGRGLRPELDAVSTHRANAMEIARLKKRRNWLALGAALSMIAPIFLVKLWDMPDVEQDKKDMADADKQSRGIVDMVIGPPTKADSPRKAADEFQGKRVVIAAGDKVIAAPTDAENPQASDPDAIELVETGTSYVPYFPRTISLPHTSSVGPEGFTSESEYQLLGLGIRKVSFLRVQVYVVGLYVKTADLSTLQNHLINTVNPTASALIPGEKDDLRKALLDPERSTQIWEAILSRDGIGAVDMAFRVVPCRGTDFKHLQDGWMRGIASRTDEVRRKQAELLRQQAVENKTVALPKPVEEGEFADESFGLAMKEFKGIFTGKGKAPKGSVIILTRDKKGALGAMYQTVVHKDGKEKMGKPAFLGEVVDPRVSRLVWLLYLGGQNVSSEDARKNIVDGCIAITERPVGTVEGMVQ